MDDDDDYYLSIKLIRMARIEAEKKERDHGPYKWQTKQKKRPIIIIIRPVSEWDPTCTRL